MMKARIASITGCRPRYPSDLAIVKADFAVDQPLHDTAPVHAILPSLYWHRG